MSRLIKDDDAVERISNAIWHLPNGMYPRFNNFDTIHAVVKDAVKGVPSIEPRAKSKWWHYEGILQCCNCSAEFYDDIVEYTGDDVPKFCPNCGADMRGEEE